MEIGRARSDPSAVIVTKAEKMLSPGGGML
ncbi:hypothetical protein SOV_39370 [Sporomusa ovata DSM 2662]|nr:hypothetical protein SOV_3c01980 [Sporomusa ovata DSM 2662]